MLESSGLRVEFGGVAALQDITFRAEPGGFLGLIGPNGAGKSTFVNCVSGAQDPTRGWVRWSGEELTGRRPDQVAAIGVARTFQHAKLFPGLTALENVMVGAHTTGRSTIFGAMFRSPAWRRDERTMREAGESALAAVHASHLVDTVADNLTAGQQRLVAVARALVARPRLLLLDEPAAGLTDTERDLLAQDLTAYVAANEVTVLLIEHNLQFLMSLVSHIIVVDRGTVLAEGSPAQIRRDPDVIAAYLGDDHAQN